MKLNIKETGHTLHGELLLRRIRERIPLTLSPDGDTFELCIDPSIGAKESYRIDTANGVCRVTGACSLGLYFGIGKLLHGATWTEDTLIPAPTDGCVTPASSFRAMYFSVHFYNWYHLASLSELERYVEDMLLWGYNTILGILPVANVTNWGDDLHTESEEKLRGGL